MIRERSRRCSRSATGCRSRARTTGPSRSRFSGGGVRVAGPRGRTDERRACEMRAAAAREDATEKNAITPGPLAPARELLGEMLLGQAMRRQRLKEFEATLKKEPNRFRAVAGAARRRPRRERARPPATRPAAEDLRARRAGAARLAEARSFLETLLSRQKLAWPSEEAAHSDRSATDGSTTDARRAGIDIRQRCDRQQRRRRGDPRDRIDEADAVERARHRLRRAERQQRPTRRRRRRCRGPGASPVRRPPTGSRRAPSGCRSPASTRDRVGDDAVEPDGREQHRHDADRADAIAPAFAGSSDPPPALHRLIVEEEDVRLEREQLAAHRGQQRARRRRACAPRSPRRAGRCDTAKCTYGVALSPRVLTL